MLNMNMSEMRDLRGGSVKWHVPKVGSGGPGPQSAFQDLLEGLREPWRAIGGQPHHLSLARVRTS